MRTSKVFRIARERIEQHKELLICHAIMASVRRCQFDSYDADRAKTIVMDRLHPCNSVEGWALRNLDWRFVSDATKDDYREFRIRWLHALEAEFKAKGD